MGFNIPQNTQNANSVRLLFEESGIAVASWARAHGFSTGLVYQVLEGKRKCLRGQSHQIAVALGLKDGVLLSLEQLNQKLHPEK